MTRNEEYQQLLKQLDKTPAALEYTLQRAQAREKACRRKWRLLGVPTGSLAVCFTVFVLLVNLFPPFAYACGGVPVLRELAKAVAWSPSLSAAVENQYVQPIGMSQTKNGITATVEYVIVDQKQVNIFFTLEGEYDFLSADRLTLSPVQQCSILGADFRQPPGTLLRFTLDYGEGNVPDGFTMTFPVFGEQMVKQDASAPLERSYEEDLLSPAEEPEQEILAEFTFDLRFDPAYTDQGERISVQKDFELDGQILTVTEAEVYPTHVRVHVIGAEENTAWLKGLGFYLEDEQGNRFETISNGIVASGDTDTPANVSFRLESTYFSRSEHLTLYITGAEWLDKEHERVEINLKDQTAPWLPEGVTLQEAQEYPDGWALQFAVEKGNRKQPFSMTFYDEGGQSYEMGSQGFSVSEGKDSVLYVPLPDYHEDRVWLEAHYSRFTQETVPVSISIK